MRRRLLRKRLGVTTSDVAETRDSFLAGQVLVRQPVSGYRGGMDAVLLAASLEAENGECLAEAGCGVGAALLCAAHRLRNARLTGFDRLAEHVAMMERSAVDNGFADHVCGEVHDIAARPKELENQFDQAFANPPYFRPDAVRQPAADRTAAYLADVPLLEWIRFLHHVVRRGGWVTVIHRAADLANLIEAMNPRFGEIEVMPIRPHPDAAAKRILVRGRKGLRPGDVKLLSGLSLADEPGGAPSARLSGVTAGEALDWR